MTAMDRMLLLTTGKKRSIVSKKSILLSSTVLMDWFWIDAHVDWLESSDVGGCEPLSPY